MESVLGAQQVWIGQAERGGSAIYALHDRTKLICLSMFHERERRRHGQYWIQEICSEAQRNVPLGVKCVISARQRMLPGRCDVLAS